MGPAGAVVDAKVDGATLWTGSQKPHFARDGVARALGLSQDKVHGIWVPGPGSYGRAILVEGRPGTMDRGRAFEVPAMPLIPHATIPPLLDRASLRTAHLRDLRGAASPQMASIKAFRVRLIGAIEALSGRDA